MNNIKVIIHTCNDRLWYVQGYLIPSLLEQGLTIEEIKIWLDKSGVGNLRAFVQCMQWISQNMHQAVAAFHIQDDVLISNDFVKQVLKYYQMNQVVCGFCCITFDKENADKTGLQPAKDLWFSFPCIGIPNEYAGQFVEWFETTGKEVNNLKDLLRKKAGDDSFFREFLLHKHFRSKGINLKPNLVEHVDFLIGGSKINKDRKTPCRSFYWGQPHLVAELQKKLGVG